LRRDEVTRKGLPCPGTRRACTVLFVIAVELLIFISFPALLVFLLVSIAVVLFAVVIVPSIDLLSYRA
jgi:hypothetical protein